ncbi:MAG: anthranilate synthase component I family protein [Alphaproteobacteria bacterium]|nr:anthranilate synthase component I family protein [Alphaproteobacteria bacterium]
MSNQKNSHSNQHKSAPSKLFLSWLEPLEIAQKISANYNGNWVFLYSGLSDSYKSSRSFIALFESEKYRGDNFDELQKIISQDQANMWFGGISYEALEQFYKFNQISNSSKKISEPKIFFSKFDVVLEFDHDKKSLLVHASDKSLVEKILSFQRIENFNEILVQNIRSNFSDLSYKKTIEDIKLMIAKGDFYQANLTRKFFGKFDKVLATQDNFKLFLDLNKASPANFSCFMKFEDLSIISSSPELFLRSKNNKIHSQPIKGTIKRGHNASQDRKNRQYLKNSLKEKAENLMIVDLMRNDFSSFCKSQSVRVKNLFKVSAYKNVFHLSSQIHGEIAQGFSIFDAIRKSFPAGSMTGAPKFKVIQNLRTFEKMKRGIYSGMLGYFLGNRELNFSVVIRTLIVSGDKFEFQVGGGITFDSDPESELQETYYKARGILQILKMSDNFKIN